MVNIIGAYNQNAAKGGYFSPKVNIGPRSQQPLTQTEAFEVGRKTGVPYENEHWAVSMAKYTAAAPVDVVDSVTALFGNERGAFNRAFYENIGLGGFGAWVERNHQGVEIASGLLGAITVAVGTEYAIGRVATSGFGAASGLGRTIGATTQLVNRSQQSAKAAMEAAAATGQALRWTAPANLQYIGARGLDAAFRAGVSEAAIVATLNKNSFIWSDDMQTNLVMAALGVGLPVAGAGIFGRAEVFRWANSPEIRKGISEAIDPAGLQRGAQAIPSTVSPKQQSHLYVNPSYELTQYALDARLVDETANTKGVSLSRPAVKTGLTGRAHELSQQIAKHGIDGVENTKFSVMDGKGHMTPAGRHVAEVLHDDPTAFLGLRSLGVADDPVEALGAREATKKRLWAKKNNSLAELETIDRISKETGLVLVGKRWLPIEDGAIFAKHKPGRVVATKMIEGAQELSFKVGEHGKTVRVREDGRLSGMKWESLDAQDVLVARDAMREQLIQMGRRKLSITVPKDASPLELDYAIEYVRRGGDVNFTKLGITNAEEAQLLSLQKKAESIKGKTSLTTEDRVRLNLPLATSLERIADPDGSAMIKLIESSKNAAGIKEVVDARKSVYKQFDLTMDVEFDGRMDGDIFNFGFDRDGNYMQPLTGFFADTPKAKWTKWDVQQASIEGKAMRIQQMRNPRQSKFVTDTVNQMLAMSELPVVSDITGLVSEQIGGTARAGSAIAASFLTQAQRFRNNPVLLAAQRFRRALNGIVQRHIDSELATMSRSIEVITSPAGVKSKIMFDSYMSLAAGWEIKAAKALPDGTIGFVLDHESTQNLRRATAAGRKLAQGDLLLNPRTGNPVVLDATANRLRIEWEAVAESLLKSRNLVRQARGLEPVKHRKFYAMPKSTRGKYVGFTLDANNKVVQGGAIVASTQKEYDRMAAAMRKEFKPGDGKRLMKQEEIANFVDLWDQADLDFIDPTSMAGPSGVQMGNLASDFIDPSSIERMLNYVKEGYENLGNGITRTILTEQLKLAEVYSKAAKATNREAKGTKNIHEVYMETLLGMPSRMNPTGVVKVLNQIDDTIDATLEQWEAGRKVEQMKSFTSEHVKSLMDMAGFPHEKAFGNGRRPSFAQLSQEMADYMPFKTVNEYAEYTLGLETPWRSRELARKVNQLGSAAILRWGEMTHAVMNMTGIITNMPGIVGAKNVPIIGRIEGVGVVDTVKLMARGFKRMLAEGDKRKIGQRLSADYEHMVRNGDATQQAAEFDIAFGQLKPGNHSAWHKFMFGDKAAPADSLRHKGLDGWLSVVTDTSESLSRRWAHFVGLELADHLKITGLEARHNFAREIANQAIANYDVWNRPEIYQNALGSMYGLFLSYAQNYYQRIWSWMELGDYKAVGRNLAMQSALFGFTGLPGFRQVAALIGGEEDGEGVMNGIYERFGPAVGSVVAQGGFNQLTTLFGLPAVALHTRGDVNFRHPTLDFASSGVLQLPVGLEVGKDLIQSVFGSLAAAAGPGGGRHAAETFAHYMPNRVLSGMVSLAGAGGDETDAYGNLMSTTKNMAEMAYRLLGFRSARQQGAIEAYYMNQKAQQIDAQRMDGVRRATRAAIRAGNFDSLPQIFDQYVEAGGAPWNYHTWIRGIMKDATESRAQNQLLRSLRNPAHQDLARRIQLFTQAYE